MKSRFLGSAHKLKFKLKKDETTKKKQGRLLVVMHDGYFDYETISETGRHYQGEIKGSEIGITITSKTKLKMLEKNEEAIIKILQDGGHFPKPVNHDEDEQEIKAEDMQQLAAEKRMKDLLAEEAKRKEDIARKPTKSLPSIPPRTKPAPIVITDDCPKPSDVPVPLEQYYAVDHSISDLRAPLTYDSPEEPADVALEEESSSSLELPAPITADNLPKIPVKPILVSPRTQEVINHLPQPEKFFELREEFAEEVTALEEESASSEKKSASSEEDNDNDDNNNNVDYAKAMLTIVVDMYLIANKTSNLGFMGLFSPHGKNGRKSARKFKELYDADTAGDTSIEALQTTLAKLIANNQGLLSGAYREDSFNTHLLAYNDMLSKLRTGELEKNIDVSLYVQDFARRTTDIKREYREIFISRTNRLTR
jgi:hypothetical protein